MTHNGACYRVPSECIVHDQGAAVCLSYQDWLYLSKHNSAFCAGVVNLRTPAQARECVIVSVGAQHTRRSFWHIRVSVDMNNALMPRDVGSQFLWKLPYTVATFMAMQLAHAGQPAETVFFNQHFPTRGSLVPAEEGFAVVDQMDTWAESVFYMSVIPSQFDLPYIREGRPISPKSTRRQASLPRCFRMCDLPDDAFAHILGSAVGGVIGGYTQRDFDTLLALRAVCKRFNTEVADQSRAWAERTICMLKRAVRAKRVSDMNEVRERIVNAGMSTIALIQDSKSIDEFTYFRWAMRKTPSSRPPRAKRKHSSTF